MAIAGIAEASAPTGEVVAALSVMGGWKPITAYSLRRHSGSGLSGSPPSEPFRSLKRATRCIISSRLQFRMSFQSLIAFPPYVSIVLGRRTHAHAFQDPGSTVSHGLYDHPTGPAKNRQRHRLPRRLQLADLGSGGEGPLREERARCKGDADAELGVPAHQPD